MWVGTNLRVQITKIEHLIYLQESAAGMNGRCNVRVRCGYGVGTVRIWCGCGAGAVRVRCG